MDKPTTGGKLAELSSELADIVAKMSQHVVKVQARRRLPSSGIIWSADGVVVTADHAIEIEEGITVGLPDGRDVPAEIVGRDHGSDIAVLRVQEASLVPAEVIASGGFRVGSLVFAIGRPTANNVTASLGIISAVSGPWRTWQGGLLDTLIQSDVSLYPGFSGGPLVDAWGRVVGLNSAALVKGSGAAIPIEIVQRVVQALLTQGRVRRGYLGVGSHPVRLPADLSQRLTLAQRNGLLVVGVEPDSPADTGGIILGDILVAFADRPLESGDDLQSLLGPDLVGTPTRLKIIRGGELREVEVTIGERT